MSTKNFEAYELHSLLEIVSFVVEQPDLTNPIFRATDRQVSKPFTDGGAIFTIARAERGAVSSSRAGARFAQAERECRNWFVTAALGGI